MKSGKIFFFILLSSLLTVSCIKEDLSNCYRIPELNLVFQYTGDEDIDIFSEKIEYVRLYIFDENGNFVQEHELYQNQLNNYQGIRLNLSEGNYQFVCWGNALEHSNFINKEDTNNYYYQRLVIKGYNTDVGIKTSDLLYYGVSQFAWKNEESSIQVLPFTSAHIKMEIYVEGLNQISGSSLFSYPIIHARELGAQYNFNMELQGKQVDFNPDMQIDITGKITFASFNTLRFNDNNSVYIDICNEKEEIIYTLDLKEFMKKNNISVETKQEAMIPIYIKFVGTDVEVSIAEWNNTNIRPIF